MLCFAALDAAAPPGSMTAFPFALSTAVGMAAGAAVGADPGVEWTRGGDLAELVSRRAQAPRVARAGVAAESVGLRLLSHTGA